MAFGTLETFFIAALAILVGFNIQWMMTTPIGLCPQDKNSYANTDSVKTTHLHLNLEVKFEQKALKGYVDFTCEAEKEATTLVLDSRNLIIHSAALVAGSQETAVKFEVATRPSHHPAAYGNPLFITFPKQQGKFIIRVYYETTPASEAIQWLSPEQTVGKEHPYLFTQGEAIHTRSMFPCQDTPSQKVTYTAKITVPKPLVAVMSAIPLEKQSSENSFEFEQKVPIPTYLIALAVGDLKSRKIGPRSRVWSEAGMLDAAEHEFAETEKFIQAAESFLTPYQFGIYDLLLLPPSFPFGGMENACLTFVTPTLLAGDRSLANVVAHEIAHSWSGNLVTNLNWEAFWLNEGFTVYIERRIIARIRSEKEAEFDSIIGYTHLQDDVDFLMGQTPEFTQLIPPLDNSDPDDSFSSVPYEKGFNFLYYLTGVVGGKKNFEEFIKAYIQHFTNKTVDSEQMKAFFLQFFEGKVAAEKLAQIEWNRWFYDKGMPHIQNKFDTSLVTIVEEAANAWLARSSSAKEISITSWSTNQRVLFFDTLMKNLNQVDSELLDTLDATYGFTSVINSEVRFKWQMLCLKANYSKIFPHVVKFITSQGRMKFVRPLYRTLAAANGGKELAVETFKQHRNSYHGIASKMIAKDLQVE